MQVNIKQQIRETTIFFAAFALALFLPAGTLTWTPGWIFIGMFFGFYIAVTLWLFKHNPGLMQERMRLSAPNQQGWDKALFTLMIIFPFAWMIFMSFDAVRFHWSSVPAWLQTAGAVILLCSFYLLFLTFRENSYLSPVVRIQNDRRQVVVSTGLYHYVRHPMYMGITIFMVGASLLLGSLYGAFLGMIYVAILARRAVLEERTLQSELSGYSTYMAEVKYRIIPYIW